MKDKSADRLMVIMTTVSNREQAQSIGRYLVSSKIAACVSTIPAVQSIYEWKGDVVEETELILLIKTLSSKVDEVINTLKKIHPYDVPEIVAISAFSASDTYLAWVHELLD
jgi:periplasmic divalent cation tolerance protein